MRCLVTAGCTVLVATIFMPPARAQIPGDPLQNAARNPIQREVGRVIEIICPPGNRLSADLQDRCNEIAGAIISAADVAGGLAGLQNMGNEEDSAVATSAVDLEQGQVGPVESRVRAGRTEGLVSTVRINGNAVPLAQHRAATGLAAGAGMTGPWTFFLDGSFALSDRDASDRQSGFETDSLIAAGGVEYTYGPAGFAGISVTYADHDADLDANAGSVETEDIQVQLYGSYLAPSGWYLDAILGYGWSDIEQARNIDYRVAGGPRVRQTARSDTESDQWWASAWLGYDWGWGAYTVSPYLRLEYAEVDIDGFRERMSNPGAPGSGLATEIDDQDVTSLPLGIGLRVARAMPTPLGELVPQVTLEYVHEFENDAEDVTGRFVDDTGGETFRLPTDDPDRDYGLAAVGASLALSERAAAHVLYQTLIGSSRLDTHVFLAGARLRW